MEVETFTMPLKDDLVSADDRKVKIGEQVRFNSGIVIKIIKTQK